LIWSGRGFRFDLSRKVAVMGILNVTPDSFSDGGLFLDPNRAIARARAMIDEGADLLDIGGESSRPGAEPLSADEEAERILPVIAAVRASTAIPVSVDTRHSRVAERALAAGANIINDISALGDPAMAEVVARHDAGLILMHMQGEPRTMQDAPHYDDVLADIAAFLAARGAAARQAGIAAERLVIDPGIGFGKTVAHNLRIIDNLRVFADLGYPVLVGPSRKRFIGAVTGREVGDRLAGTLAAVALAVYKGARLVRVHDVNQAADAAALAEALLRVGHE